MIQTVWRLILEEKMSQCHTIQMEHFALESLEVQAILQLFGQPKEQCRVGMHKGTFGEDLFH